MLNSLKRDYLNSYFGIYKKFLLSFFIVASIPILIFGMFSIYTLNSTSDVIYQDVKNSIDENTKVTLELQAILTANAVENFLKERESDLLSLKELPINKKDYLNFYNQHRSTIWTKASLEDSTIGKKTNIPLYKEISFINKDGLELLKIADGTIKPRRSLKNIIDIKNTTYFCEDYFKKASNLEDGKIYTSHVTGFYVTKQKQINSEDFELYYNGIIRFATPIYKSNQLAGLVSIALDHRHLMEFTQHIVPNKKEENVYPVYSSGNYAFMFDDEGWIITHPKLWDIRGVDSCGIMIPAYTSNTSLDDINNGYIPFNLDDAAFIHPNYPFVSDEVRGKNSGTVITINVGGTEKLMAYAPIEYSSGDYSKDGVFGGITIGVELNKFHQPAISISERLKSIIQLLVKNTLLFIFITSLVVAFISWFISRHFSIPLLQISKGAKQLAEGKFQRPIEINRRDEIGYVASSFNYMAIQLKENKAELIQSVDDLRSSKQNVESYATDLENQINIFKSIQNISNLLGSSFELENILELILKQCVEIVQFDRAILYMVDDSEKYLEVKGLFGFSESDELKAKKSKFNIETFDCIETRVVKEQKVIYVENFKEYSNATKRDKKINEIRKSNSFVFVPLKVKEKIIGIMGADKFESDKVIKEIDIPSLQIFANQVSRVIENTRLYNEIISQRNFAENIFSHMTNGIISLDLDENITSINNATENILEISKEILIGKNINKVLAEYSEIINKIQQAYEEDGYFKDYALKINVNSKTKYIYLGVSPLTNEDGTNSGVIVVLQDVTEKREFDNNVQRIEKLASLGRLAAGLAHEIRNPLTGVSLFLDDLHDKSIPNSDTSKVILQALSEIERMENLINELLDYASPKTENFQLTDISKIIESIISFTAKQCQQSKIEIRLNSEKLPLLNIDKEKLRQAFLNIILNSIQVMPDGGIIEINVTNKIKYSDKVWTLIAFSDTGSGIPTELYSQIFDPFFTTRSEGTGLGLSITHNIIQEHNGIIEVDKTKKGGALFNVYLPFKKNKV